VVAQEGLAAPAAMATPTPIAIDRFMKGDTLRFGPLKAVRVSGRRAVHPRLFGLGGRSLMRRCESVGGQSHRNACKDNRCDECLGGLGNHLE